MSLKNRDNHNRWRNKTVAFRVSPEEDAQIETFVKLSGLTKPCFAANTTPITPPKQALMTNEAIFIFTIGMPTARAAVSSSRMAVHARPSFEFSSLWQIRMTAAASSRTMKYI